MKQENIHDWKTPFVFWETIEAMHNLCLTVYIMIKTKGYSNIQVVELKRGLFGSHIRTFPFIAIYPPSQQK